MKLLFMLLLFAATAHAETYYVGKADTSASDLNPGTIVEPWRTIGRAAAVMVAGDSVFVGNGTYDERVTPRNSGTSNDPITYAAMPLASPKVRGFTLTGKNYTTIMQFEITNLGMSPDPYNAAIVATGSIGTWLLSNSIHDTVQQAIRCNPNGTAAKCIGLTARGNTMTRIGPKWDGIKGHPGRAPIIELWGDDSLIEENDMSHGEDFLRVFGRRNVFRNNVLHDSVEAETAGGNQHIDGFQSFCSTNNKPESASYLLVEGNTFRDNPGLNTHFGLINGTLANGTVKCAGSSSTVIIRGNLLVNVGSASYVSDANNNRADHHKYYSNTTVSGAVGVSPKRAHATVSLNGTRFGSVINNIFVDAVAFDPRYYQPAQVYVLDASGTSEGRNNLAYLTTGPIAWGNPILSAIGSILNRDPLLAGTTDFRLMPGSPALGSGGPLTTVAASDAGSGQSLHLADAHFFQPGWAGVRADCIAIGTPSNIGCVAAIDYFSGTVILEAPLVRSAGDKVWLASDSKRTTISLDMGGF